MQGMNESPMESRKAQARAWFENLQDQIIAYLRECLSAEPEPAQCALVVE